MQKLSTDLRTSEISSLHIAWREQNEVANKKRSKKIQSIAAYYIAGAVGAGLDVISILAFTHKIHYLGNLGSWVTLIGGTIALGIGAFNGTVILAFSDLKDYGHEETARKICFQLRHQSLEEAVVSHSVQHLRSFKLIDAASADEMEKIFKEYWKNQHPYHHDEEQACFVMARPLETLKADWEALQQRMQLAF